MITLDTWYKQKIDALRLKGEHLNLQKRAPLDAFYNLAKVKKISGLRDQKEWTQLYSTYLKTGSIPFEKMK